MVEPYHAHWERTTAVLLEPWRARGRPRELLRAGIALALSFDTWRQLVREQGLAEGEAIELGLRLAADTPDAVAAAVGSPVTRATAPT